MWSTTTPSATIPSATIPSATIPSATTPSATTPSTSTPSTSTPSTSTPSRTAPRLPRYLFRVWTDSSNGHNSPTSIESAWAAWSETSIYRSKPQEKLYRILRVRLQGALNGSTVKDNPFVFTTSSLLYAIQHAIAKTKGRGESNAHIICIDTQTCKRPNGRDIRFHTADYLMNVYGLGTIRARYTQEERNYSDVWVTTDCIIPGKGSYHVSFDELKAIGLYKLYPEFAEVERRNNPGLETPVKGLRKWWYNQQRDLPTNEFTLAAKLANACNPIRGTQPAVDVPNHLLAWFIALKGQRRDGKRLRRWLESHDPRPGGVASGADVRKARIPELDRYRQVYAVVRRHRIAVARVIESRVRVGLDRLEMQADSFKDSKKKRKTGDGS